MPSPRALILPLAAVVVAVAALLLPWTHHTECRIDTFLWEVPTRRTPATLTLAAAATTGIGSAVLALLAGVRAARVPRAARLALAVASLGAAAGAAVTLPRSTCHWDDSLGGGASQAVWGPGPVLLLLAGALTVLSVAVRVGTRRPG